MKMDFTFHPIGFIQSSLQNREDAPKQGSEGAPDAWLEVKPEFADALEGITAGDELIVISWFHKSNRETLKVHPRGNQNNPLTGVFATRSPDRPNPLGLHPVIVRKISGNHLLIGPIETIDGTPIIDIKPVLN
jgi:tRNA-Thr(GGU) m(6)t(6)A37 methyltransferase TsaA